MFSCLFHFLMMLINYLCLLNVFLLFSSFKYLNIFICFWEGYNWCLELYHYILYSPLSVALMYMLLGLGNISGISFIPGEDQFLLCSVVTDAVALLSDWNFVKFPNPTWHACQLVLSLFGSHLDNHNVEILWVQVTCLV